MNNLDSALIELNKAIEVIIDEKIEENNKFLFSLFNTSKIELMIQYINSFCKEHFPSMTIESDLDEEDKRNAIIFAIETIDENGLLNKISNMILNYYEELLDEEIEKNQKKYLKEKPNKRIKVTNRRNGRKHA